MTAATLAALTSYLDMDIRTGSGGIPQTCSSKMVAITVAWLGCQTGYQQLSVLFGISEDALIRCTEKVMARLNEKSKELIQFPKKAQFQSIAEEFNSIGKKRYFPHTVGALDAMHLRVDVKKKMKVPYYNNLKWHSILLQAITDANKKFLDVFVG